jgi:HPt (histidine-containing phosphotransfer) domain-containing protein
MLTLFVSDTEDMLQRMQKFTKDRNARAVAGLAHELKASSASLGTKQLARLSLFLEQAVGQQDWLEAEQTLNSLNRSFEHLKGFVQASVCAEQPAEQSLPK